MCSCIAKNCGISRTFWNPQSGWIEQLDSSKIKIQAAAILSRQCLEAESARSGGGSPGAAESVVVQPAHQGATQMFWFHVVSLYFTVGGYILG